MGSIPHRGQARSTGEGFDGKYPHRGQNRSTGQICFNPKIKMFKLYLGSNSLS